VITDWQTGTNAVTRIVKLCIKRLLNGIESLKILGFNFTEKRMKAFPSNTKQTGNSNSIERKWNKLSYFVIKKVWTKQFIKTGERVNNRNNEGITFFLTEQNRWIKAHYLHGVLYFTFKWVCVSCLAKGNDFIIIIKTHFGLFLHQAHLLFVQHIKISSLLVFFH